MAIFGPKPWVNPFGKMSIFRLFELLLFIFQKNFFFVLEYHKRQFPGLYCLKKKFEKWPYLDQNDGLTCLEKGQFYDFLNFLYLYSRKASFRSRTSQTKFSRPILPRKKVGKMAIFGTKPWVNPFGKMSISRRLNFLFLQPRKAFFRSRIP